MNLLKVNIKDINLEEVIRINDSADDLYSYTSVDMITECHGSNNRVITKFPTKEWEEIKKQGYYMA